VAAVKRASKGELFFLPAIAERLANLSVRGEQSPLHLLYDCEVVIFT
jgi:hypothetical protein